MLETIQIASPCSAEWDEMVGDARARFCGHCQKNVYNLSAMLAEDAERLLQERAGDACVRFYARADGTVITEDCPVGVKRKRRRKAALAIAGAGALAFGALTSVTRTTMGEPARTTTVAPVADARPTGFVPGEVAIREVAGPIEPATSSVVGSVAAPPPAVTPPARQAMMGGPKWDPPQPPKRPLMGKPAPPRR